MLRLPKSKNIYLRAGYNSRAAKNLGGFTGFSSGVGFSIGRIGLDYAWVPFGELGDTHRIGLRGRF